MFSITPIPAFSDNYIWCITDNTTRKALIVDPGQSEPVAEYLKANNLELDAILITHHHPDHVGGVPALVEQYRPGAVYGPKESPFKGATVPLSEGDTLNWSGISFSVLEVPGHTLDHIAYVTTSTAIDGAPAVFCGDTLFACGCGRLFEGTPAQMRHSLEKLRKLSDETRVYCAHEYTLANLRFSRDLLPSDAGLEEFERRCITLRENDAPTLPTTIAEERSLNLFLRWDDSAVIDAIENRSPSIDESLAGHDRVFALIRKAKDTF
ncbi:hydroxyacylglutathione hydrolase [Marinobacter sp. BGYM27]|uniref:hydroxyacylglutathione hydrolase n=1 Tax=Marinobacter sp. BGYM27 TaxID=2975597 RepID=UPI0021A447B9|nr:hydroxyacylglutathione hydrolase [Marinobacter sp. BGYM27]MDG5499111.1 hydroxyacylglutathione hydrolase [Marinobacter sp. BGYM27]